MHIQKDIKRMSRKDLLEILVLQNKKIDELEKKLNEANKLLETKKIILLESGSIAEASLRLNKVFEIAQQSANQYLDNIKRIEMEQEDILLKIEKKYSKVNQSKRKNILKHK